VWRGSRATGSSLLAVDLNNRLGRGARAATRPVCTIEPLYPSIWIAADGRVRDQVCASMRWTARGGSLVGVRSDGQAAPECVVLPRHGITPPSQFCTVPIGSQQAKGCRSTFGAERGELTLGVCEVSIPRDHRVGELESQRIWRLQFRADPSKHVALLSTVRMEGHERSR